jgi:CRP/FNR family transcriptional regulator
MLRVDFLSTVQLFKGLTDRELEALSQSAIERRYLPGQYLIDDSEPSERLFLIWEGRVKLTKSSFSGKEQTLQIYGPGDLVGLFSLFTGSSFPAAAIALSACRALIFPRILLERSAEKIPSLMVNLFYALAARQSECIRTVGSLALKETPQRLAAFLLLELNKSNKKNEVTLGYSHRELAKIIGTSPETLSRVLSSFIHDGIIEQNGRSISVLKRTLLENLEEGIDE